MRSLLSVLRKFKKKKKKNMTNFNFGQKCNGGAFAFIFKTSSIHKT